MATDGTEQDDSIVIGQRLTAARLAFQAGDLQHVASHCDFILDRDPSHEKALRLLCVAHLNFGNTESALSLAERLVALAPDNATYLTDLGLALFHLDRLEEAEHTFDRAITLNPALMEPRSNKAAIQVNNAQFLSARATLQEVLELDPQNANALSNMGVVHRKLGHIEEALEFFDQAIVQSPTELEFVHNRLMLLNYSSSHGFAEVSRQTQVYCDLLRGHDLATPKTHQANAKDADKSPLKVGFVSGDFRRHSVGYLFKTAIDALNETKIQTVLYSNNPFDDDLTEDLKAVCGLWRDIQDKADDDVAKIIRDDQIDILVDVSGYTDGERLGVFRRKPAPVQMSWLGYYATTGLDEVDFIIADQHVLPPDDEGLYQEKPLRLPHTYFCYTPPAQPDATSRNPLQDIEGEHAGLTFGSFNNIDKFNKDVIRVWAQILNAVPQSRLVIKAPQVTNDQVAAAVQDLFALHGIGPDVLTVFGAVDRDEHFAMYSSIDIALDPFPYGGALTTLEALSMGVPVITMRCDRWVSRMGPSVLSTIGLADLITDTPEDYIRMAVNLAEKSDYRAGLRNKIRPMMEASPLCDAVTFARDLENVFRQAWRSWCLGSSVGSSTGSDAGSGAGTAT